MKLVAKSRTDVLQGTCTEACIASVPEANAETNLFPEDPL